MGKTKFNLVRERWVNEGDYGYIPRISYISNNYEFSIGANFIYHKSEHYGLILWADSLPSCCREPNRKYYYYNLDKVVANAYLQLILKPTNKLKILTTYLNAYNQSKFYNYYPIGMIQSMILKTAQITNAQIQEKNLKMSEVLKLEQDI
jgi:hypothetical protein